MQKPHDNPTGRTHGHRHSNSHAGFTESHVYAPNELSIVGGAAVGPFVDSLLESLRGDYEVMCLNHAIRGDWGQAGTAEMWDPVAHGASAAYAVEGGRYALVGEGSPDRWTAGILWNDADILLVENDLNPSLSKIILVEQASDLPDRAERDGARNVIAYVGSRTLPKGVVRSMRDAAAERPIFDLADTRAVAAFILEYLRNRALARPLYGLVLGGGKSVRMRRDKATITYRGVPQARYAYELLGGVCNRSFVSIRAEQANDEVFAGLEQIHDRFSGIGPMGGILSAMHTHPEASWLVLGCDLPFVDDATLRDLISRRDAILQATCYESSHDGLPEPLCAVYEPRYRRRLHQFLSEGRDCPRKALINTRVRRLTLRDPAALDNINSPEDYERAAARIREEAGRAG